MIFKRSCETEATTAEKSALPSKELITFLNILEYKTLILNGKHMIKKMQLW